MHSICQGFDSHTLRSWQPLPDSCDAGAEHSSLLACENACSSSAASHVVTSWRCGADGGGGRSAASHQRLLAGGRPPRPPAALAGRRGRAGASLLQENLVPSSKHFECFRTRTTLCCAAAIQGTPGTPLHMHDPCSRAGRRELCPVLNRATISTPYDVHRRRSSRVCWSTCTARSRRTVSWRSCAPPVTTPSLATPPCRCLLIIPVQLRRVLFICLLFQLKRRLQGRPDRRQALLSDATLQIHPSAVYLIGCLCRCFPILLDALLHSRLPAWLLHTSKRPALRCWACFGVSGAAGGGTGRPEALAVCG